MIIEPDIEDLITKCNSSTTAPSFSPPEVACIRKSLVDWFHVSRRKLPWRGDTLSGYETPALSAYGTWVSEVMLQQTRVETVISYWFKWMKSFPTVQSLAVATPDEVNTLWAGLGYYRRAQLLRKGAEMVVNEFNGVIPSNVADLRKIPGIGPYTAGAIASIAFNKTAALVDGNVMRVMSRLRAIDLEVGPKLEKVCWTLAGSVIDPVEPGAFNQALMELGATVCKPTSPACDACPVQSVCRAHERTRVHVGAGGVTDFPRRAVKKKPREVHLALVALYTDSIRIGAKPSAVTVSEPSTVPDLTPTAAAAAAAENGSAERWYLFVRRPDKGLLAGQWEFPNIVLWEEGDGDGEGEGEGGAVDSGDIPSGTSLLTGEGEGEREGKGEGVDKGLWSRLCSHLCGCLGVLVTDIDSYDSSNAHAHTHTDIAASTSTGAGTMEDDAGGKDTLLREKACGVSTESPPVCLVSPMSQSELAPRPRPALAPIVHVFSHQRHTMHVTARQVHVHGFRESRSLDNLSGIGSDTGPPPPPPPPLVWRSRGTDSQNLEVRWMTEGEVTARGMTSGVRKVLAALSQPLAPPRGSACDGPDRSPSDARSAKATHTTKATRTTKATGPRQGRKRALLSIHESTATHSQQQQQQQQQQQEQAVSRDARARLRQQLITDSLK